MATTRATRSTPIVQYLRATEAPWPSLLLLLPLVVLYEVSTRGWLSSHQAMSADQLVAFALIRRGFDALGATGSLLPALTLVGCLFGWHLAQRGSWRVRPAHLVGMTLEGMLLALPIVGLALAMSRWLPCLSVADGSLQRLATLAVGAALYEELIFRLLGFIAIHMLLVEILGFSRRWGDVFTLFSTAALFAGYHYLGHESFTWSSFVFRTGAGIFLGSVFLSRGFGVTVVCHATYDLVWIAVFARFLGV